MYLCICILVCVYVHLCAYMLVSMYVLVHTCIYVKVIYWLLIGLSCRYLLMPPLCLALLFG